MAVIPPPPSYPPPGYAPPPPPPLPPSPKGMRVALVALIALSALAVVLATTIGIVLVVRDSGDGPGPSDGGSSASEPASQDDQVIAGVEAIARGAEEYAGTYGYGPAVDDALPTGLLAQFVDPWPTNPYTGEPMTQGYGPGDYSFSTAISMGDGQEYLGYVTGNLSDGETYAVEFTY